MEYIYIYFFVFSLSLFFFFLLSNDIFFVAGRSGPPVGGFREENERESGKRNVTRDDYIPLIWPRRRAGSLLGTRRPPTKAYASPFSRADIIFIIIFIIA